MHRLISNIPSLSFYVTLVKLWSLFHGSHVTRVEVIIEKTLKYLYFNGMYVKRTLEIFYVDFQETLLNNNKIQENVYSYSLNNFTQ